VLIIAAITFIVAFLLWAYGQLLNDILFRIVIPVVIALGTAKVIEYRCEQDAYRYEKESLPSICLVSARINFILIAQDNELMEGQAKRLKALIEEMTESTPHLLG
jgi:hypothetical protein